MRIVLALPPHLPRQWSDLLQEQQVRHALASYAWFANARDTEVLRCYAHGEPSPIEAK